LHGNGAVDYGPVPTLPNTAYLTDLQRKGAYSFDVAKAARMLSAHGWSVKASGTSTCARPGTGAGQCGAGIAVGAKLSFNLVYAAGIPEVSQEMQAWKSDLSRVGITLNLSQAPTGDVFSTITPCTAKQAVCAWQMAYWGNGWEFAPDYYPSGEVAFSTGAIGNWGSYSDKQMDAKIEATTVESSTTAFHDWADYTTAQLPMLFLPLAASQVSAVKSTVHGAFPQPVAGLAITPENWYLTK
jgi:peptide/nickel transport system substrate-binding protein